MGDGVARRILWGKTGTDLSRKTRVNQYYVGLCCFFVCNGWIVYLHIINIRMSTLE